MVAVSRGFAQGATSPEVAPVGFSGEEPMTLSNEEMLELARAPAKAQQDGRMAEQHQLSDVLEVQRALASDEAAALPRGTVNGHPRSHFGLRVATFYPMD